MDCIIRKTAANTSVRAKKQKKERARKRRPEVRFSREKHKSSRGHEQRGDESGNTCNDTKMPQKQHSDPPMSAMSLQNIFANNSDGSDIFEPVSSRRAAVLVGLFVEKEEWNVLLTQRSSKLRSHSGQVCLPGGKNDAGESNIQTALRESMEEVGLHENNVKQILGQVPPRLSAHLLSVTPVVCIIDRPMFKTRKRTRSSVKSDETESHKDLFVVSPNDDEVESVFTVPLSLFLKTSPKHSFYDYTFHNHKVRIHEFQYMYEGRSYNIWGLTAHILIDIAARIFGNESEATTRSLIELDPPGLPRHIDLKVAEKGNEDEEYRIEVSVCADG